jgi:hypothetical protein
VSLIGYADLDRPIAFDSGRIYYPFGGGPYQLEPYRCAVTASRAGPVEFQLDLIRAFSDRDAHAVLSCTIGADYAVEAALARVRQTDPMAALSPCVLTDWWFRLFGSPALRVPPELDQPVLLASNGLGTARLLTPLSLESGLMLEAMLQEGASVPAVAEARMSGISPRLPVVVRFETSVLLPELLALADAARVLPRRLMVDYFSRDAATLPLDVSGTVDAGSVSRFAEAMTDRIIGGFGRYVPPATSVREPVARLDPPATNHSIIWSLSQPFLAARRIALPVDLLSAAQAQATRLGIDSVVHRRTLAAVPSFGESRVTVLCNLPAPRSGVEALGVTLTFPPHPPERPQEKQATVLFEAADDIGTADVRLSPGEPLRYRYSPFAVMSDDGGIRQLDARDEEYGGSPLRLVPDDFPIEFAVIEITPALGELAVVGGLCSWAQDGRIHSRAFTLDSGQLSLNIAVPRDRASLSIECVASARDGQGELRAGPFEAPQVRLDLSSFAQYGPQHVDVQCVFDDAATMRAVSFLPLGSDDVPDNVTTMSFTPAEPLRTFGWFAASPFKAGFRYRAYDGQGGEWTAVPDPTATLVLTSSRLRKQERAREVAARSQRATREVVPRRPGARFEAAAAAQPEAAMEAIATSPEPDPTDELLYSRVDDASRKLFVPRYALDVLTVSGQQRYRVAMAQHEISSTLEVNLVALPAVALGDAARDAAEYPHLLGIQLEFLIAPPAGAKKVLEFTDVTRNGAIVTATMTFATLPERDDVYRALTEPGRGARLLVRRTIDVLIPERPAPGLKLPHGRFTDFALPPRPITTWLKPLPGLEPIGTGPVVVTDPLPPIASPVPGGALSPVAVGRLSPVAVGTFSPIAVGRLSPVAAGMFTRVERAPAGPVLASRLTGASALVRAARHFAPSLPTPTLAFTGKTVEGDITRCRLNVVNWADYSDEFFAASPDLPPCGRNTSAARTWVDIYDADTDVRLYGFCALSSAKQLADLWFAVTADRTVPARVSVTLTDRRTNVVTRSNAVATTSPEADVPPYRAVRQPLDQVIEPFVFPPALHGYMFQGITPGSGSDDQLVRYRCQWRGTFHTYLQDASRPSVVYCFADRFKVARRRDAPFTPFITVRATSRPDATATDVVFDYIVAPYTDPKRLEDARAQLLAEARFGATQVEFQPFLTSDVRYFIDRPAETGAVREQRPDAAVVLQGALKDTLTMSLMDFKLLFNAMQNKTAALFLGRVEIDVPDGSTEVIPFEARMDDLEGEMFSYEATGSQDGSVRVTIANEIESPVSIQTLDATMTSAGRRVRGLVQGTSLPCARLLPGEAIQVTVAPAAPMGATSPPEVAFDLSGVTVMPDPEAIWNSILDRSTLECFKEIKVKVIPGVFEPVAGREAERIEAVLAAFEGGGTAELSADALEAKVRIDYPIDDVVLNRPVSSSYRYTVTVLRKDGSQDRDAAPREGSGDLLYVPVTR